MGSVQPSPKPPNLPTEALDPEVRFRGVNCHTGPQPLFPKIHEHAAILLGQAPHEPLLELP